MEITVARDEESGVALLTLNAPERRNAISLEMAEEIGDALTSLEHDDNVRALVIHGAGTAFCAGANLSVLDVAGESELRRIYGAFLRVRESPLPTIAAVNGVAVGAGANLALACDVRLACAETRIDVRFLRLGVHPGGGNTWMLSRLVGSQSAAAMLLFGEVLVGDQCTQSGFSWETVVSDRLLDRAKELAARAAAFDPELLRRTKSTLERSYDLSFSDILEIELDHQLWSLRRKRERDSRPTT